MSCEKFQKQISEYIDNELNADDEARFCEHIANCPECEKKLKAHKTLSDSVGKIKEKLPEGFEIKLPRKEKGKIIKMFRRHQGLVSAAVAVIALMIFSNGINNESYKPSSVADSEKGSGSYTEFSPGVQNAKNETNKEVTPTADMFFTEARNAAISFDNIINYELPPEDEFKDKSEYKRLSSLIDDLKKKASGNSDEQGSEIITEFENLLKQIENAKNNED